MAATSSPYGFQPISDGTGIPRPLRIPNGINSGLAANIFKYELVKVDTAHGTITPITAAADGLLAIFAGVEYTPSGGRPAVSPYWPSGTTYDTTQMMNAYVWPLWNPNLRIQAQADGSVAQTSLFFGFNSNNFSNGSTTTGLSQATINHTSVGSSATSQFALIEFATSLEIGGSGSSVPGDAFTDLILICTRPLIGAAAQNALG